MRLNLSDPLQLNRLGAHRGYSPDTALPASERVHLAPSTSASTGARGAAEPRPTSTTCSGPTKTGPQGLRRGCRATRPRWSSTSRGRSTSTSSGSDSRQPRPAARLPERPGGRRPALHLRRALNFIGRAQLARGTWTTRRARTGGRGSRRQVVDGTVVPEAVGTYDSGVRAATGTLVAVAAQRGRLLAERPRPTRSRTSSSAGSATTTSITATRSATARTTPSRAPSSTRSAAATS